MHCGRAVRPTRPPTPRPRRPHSWTLRRPHDRRRRRGRGWAARVSPRSPNGRCRPRSGRSGRRPRRRLPARLLWAVTSVSRWSARLSGAVTSGSRWWTVHSTTLRWRSRHRSHRTRPQVRAPSTEPATAAALRPLPRNTAVMDAASPSPRAFSGARIHPSGPSHPPRQRRHPPQNGRTVAGGNVGGPSRRDRALCPDCPSHRSSVHRASDQLPAPARR